MMLGAKDLNSVLNRVAQSEILNTRAAPPYPSICWVSPPLRGFQSCYFLSYALSSSNGTSLTRDVHKGKPKIVASC